MKTEPLTWQVGGDTVSCEHKLQYFLISLRFSAQSPPPPPPLEKFEFK